MDGENLIEYLILLSHRFFRKVTFTWKDETYINSRNMRLVITLYIL